MLHVRPVYGQKIYSSKQVYRDQMVQGRDEYGLNK